MPDLGALGIDLQRCRHAALKLVDIDGAIEQEMGQRLSVVNEGKFRRRTALKLCEAASMPELPDTFADLVPRTQGRSLDRWNLYDC